MYLYFKRNPFKGKLLLQICLDINNYMIKTYFEKNTELHVFVISYFILLNVVFTVNDGRRIFIKYRIEKNIDVLVHLCILIIIIIIIIIINHS